MSLIKRLANFQKCLIKQKSNFINFKSDAYFENFEAVIDSNLKEGLNG